MDELLKLSTVQSAFPSTRNSNRQKAIAKALSVTLLPLSRQRSKFACCLLLTSFFLPSFLRLNSADRPSALARCFDHQSTRNGKRWSVWTSRLFGKKGVIVGGRDRGGPAGFQVTLQHRLNKRNIQYRTEVSFDLRNKWSLNYIFAKKSVEWNYQLGVFSTHISRRWIM